MPLAAKEHGAAVKRAKLSTKEKLQYAAAIAAVNPSRGGSMKPAASMETGFFTAEITLR